MGPARIQFCVPEIRLVALGLARIVAVHDDETGFFWLPIDRSPLFPGGSQGNRPGRGAGRVAGKVRWVLPGLLGEL